MKLFLGIEIPSSIKKELDHLFFGLPGARWVGKDQLHITLRYLGEVNFHQMKDLDDSLKMISFPSFRVSLKSVGAFYNKKYPKSAWVGVNESVNLFNLQKKVEGTVRHTLTLERKKFIPHLTLARLRETSFHDMANYLELNSLFTAGPWEVDHFNLYSSVSSSDGVRYSIEQSYSLS
jgi:2'-5' RNA ligase